MLSKSPLLQRNWLPWRRKESDMQRMLESHFWSLTRYRIGSRFLGLDYAGNVIFYPAYRKMSFGGWNAVTLGAPGSNPASFFSSDLSTVNVLEDGYPMHYRATQKLQKFVSEERRKWLEAKVAEEKKVKETLASQKVNESSSTETNSVKTENLNVTKAKGGVQSVEASSRSSGAFNPASSVEAVSTTQFNSYDSEQQFRDMLVIKCSHPNFFTRRLRISRLATFLYKCLYFYLWGVLVSLIIQGYLLFRSWVNPPARAGLKNIEEHALHIPRLLFAGCVYGVAWCVRTAQPVIDPVVDLLSKYFPQVNWNVASAESIASKAEHLADDTHPAAKQRKEHELQVQQQAEQERRTWWSRILLVLLAVFSILCILETIKQK